MIALAGDERLGLFHGAARLLPLDRASWASLPDDQGETRLRPREEIEGEFDGYHPKQVLTKIIGE